MFMENGSFIFSSQGQFLKGVYLKNENLDLLFHQMKGTTAMRTSRTNQTVLSYIQEILHWKQDVQEMMKSAQVN